MINATNKASIAGMLVLALISSAAVAGGKPIGGGGGSKGGGGDTGTGVSATLGVSGGAALCNWTGKSLSGTVTAYCTGYMSAKYSCAVNPVNATFYDEDVASVRKNGTGTAQLINALPSVSGSNCTLCTVSFTSFSAGILGNNASTTPIPDTLIVVNAC